MEKATLGFFIYKIWQIFHFVLLYFFPNECPGLSTFEVGIIAQPHACKHFVFPLFFNFFSTLYYSSKRKIWDLLTADFAWLCCSRFWFLDFGNNTIYECTVVFKFPDRFFWQKKIKCWGLKILYSYHTITTIWYFVFVISWFWFRSMLLFYDLVLFFFVFRCCFFKKRKILQDNTEIISFFFRH